MKIPNEGYYSKFTHVEVGRFSSENNKMFREGKGNSGLIHWDDIRDYASKNNNTGIYHSIRHYDLGQGGIDGPSLAPLHFDIDNKEDPSKSLEDVSKILHYMIDVAKVPNNAMSVYFSGQKGYHFELEPIAVRLNLVNENSAAIFRYVAEELVELLDLSSVDFAVYDSRRMWRLAGSIHQATGLYKIPCKEMVLNDASHKDIAKAAKRQPTEEELEIPEQSFSSAAAMFFTEKVALYEAKLKEREEDKLKNFLSNGFSRSAIPDDSVVREFTPTRLRDNCSAIDDLILKAEHTGNLEHYERLFLCSILSHTPEGIEYLQKILSMLDDYNFEISNLHIEDWIMRRRNGIGGRPYTCAKGQSVGIMCSSCPELQPKSYENSLGAEHIAEPSPVRFAYKYHSKE